MPTPTPPPPRVYGAPRRFDLATLLSVSTASALLFGVLRLLGAGPWGFFLISAFLTWVALAQAVLYGGKRPRLASLWAGGAVGLVGACWLSQNNLPWQWSLLRGPWDFFLLLFGLVVSCSCGFAFWAFLGYLAGALIAGVFLIADGIRRRLQRRPAPPLDGEQNPPTM